MLIDGFSNVVFISQVDGNVEQDSRKQHMDKTKEPSKM